MPRFVNGCREKIFRIRSVHEDGDGVRPRHHLAVGPDIRIIGGSKNAAGAIRRRLPGDHPVSRGGVGLNKRDVGNVCPCRHRSFELCLIGGIQAAVPQGRHVERIIDRRRPGEAEKIGGEGAKAALTGALQVDRAGFDRIVIVRVLPFEANRVALEICWLITVEAHHGAGS